MKGESSTGNLERFNRARSSGYIELVQSALERVPRKKHAFSSMGQLAEHVSRTTGIHRTTLMRNAKYTKMLCEAFSRQKGVVDRTELTGASAAILQAKLLAATLENSNLREELRRLKQYVGSADIQHEFPASTQPKEVDSYYRAFVDTALALSAVLERLQDTVTLNLTAKTIDDLAVPPSKRIIVGMPRIGAFLKWLQMQPEFLGKK